MDNFAGKVAVITGAGSGFGRELARIASKLGMNLVLADVQRDALDSTVAVNKPAASEGKLLVLTQGRVIAKLGDFAGIDRNEAPKDLLWPNTFAFHGDDILVTNLSLDVGAVMTQLADEFGAAYLKAMNLRTVDGPWAHEVKLHTVSKIKKWIPQDPKLYGSTR